MRIRCVSSVISCLETSHRRCSSLRPFLLFLQWILQETKLLVLQSCRFPPMAEWFLSCADTFVTYTLRRLQMWVTWSFGKSIILNVRKGRKGERSVPMRRTKDWNYRGYCSWVCRQGVLLEQLEGQPLKLIYTLKKEFSLKKNLVCKQSKGIHKTAKILEPETHFWNYFF